MNKRENREIITQFLLLGLSCLNTSLIYVYLIFVFLEIRNGAKGFLKMCLFFTIRQCFYFPGLSVINSTGSNIKLTLFTVGAIIVIFAHINATTTQYLKSGKTILLFGVVSTISAFVFGSFPIAGIIKTASFTLVFYAVYIAWIDCHDRFDVLDYTFRVLSVLMAVSFLLVFFPASYMGLSGGGAGFRGIWGHSNDFGVLCGMYIAIFLVHTSEIRIKHILWIIIIMIMIYLSRSRGAMISAIAIMCSYVVFADDKYNKQKVRRLLIVMVLAVVCTSIGHSMVSSFFVKGGSSSGSISYLIRSSREEIMNTAFFRFESSPLFGRGLLIEYIPGVRDYSFSNDGTEPGNIFFELLAGTGLVGILVFTLMIVSFLSESNKSMRILPLAVIFTSISEVSLFSVNNYAALYYLMMVSSIPVLMTSDDEISLRQMR